MGKDDPQIPMDPSEFILAPYSMIDVEYNSWGSGVPYVEWLLEGLDYEKFNITHLMPSHTTQVYAQPLLFLFLFFTFFIMISNGGEL